MCSVLSVMCMYIDDMCTVCLVNRPSSLVTETGGNYPLDLSLYVWTSGDCQVAGMVVVVLEPANSKLDVSLGRTEHLVVRVN
jgi:hypothetical protein